MENARGDTAEKVRVGTWQQASLDNLRDALLSDTAYFSLPFHERNKSNASPSSKIILQIKQACQ